MNGEHGVPLFSRAEFEAIKHDPLLILARATEMINRLRQEEMSLEGENKILQQQLGSITEGEGFDSQRYRKIMDATAELERDHRSMSIRCSECELANARLMKLIEELRQEKETLRKDLTGLESTRAALAVQHRDTLNAIQEIERSTPEETARMKCMREAIDKKIESLDSITKDIVHCTRDAVNLQKKMDKLGSEHFALEAETVALEQTTKQQERTVNYLQHESAQLDEAINKKKTELVEMKKQTSAVLLELQLQVTRAEEEMTRLHNAVAKEKELTGRQNVWQAKELHAKTEELLSIYQEKATEQGKMKSELAILQEKADRLKNNALVVEKQSHVLSDTLKHLEVEDEFLTDSYTKRKNKALEEMKKQTVVVQELKSEIQKAREDLYLMKSRSCKECRTSIFQGDDVVGLLTGAG